MLTSQTKAGIAELKICISRMIVAGTSVNLSTFHEYAPPMTQVYHVCLTAAGAVCLALAGIVCPTIAGDTRVLLGCGM